MIPVSTFEGGGPVVLGMPHTGTFVPENIEVLLNENGKKLSDTDWHIDRLYEGLLDNVTTVKANFHRYVIDANRDPSGVSLYPGQNTTELCPTTDFDNVAIYKEGMEPSVSEINARTEKWHKPYHAALQAALDKAKEKHGFAILYDCHSIRSNIPFLFEGTLPDLNIGTNLGATCAPEIETGIFEICQKINYSTVLNGRFKGGWTTRHYGRPSDGFHTIQMEIAQSVYMSEKTPWTYREEKADKMRIHLKKILKLLEDLAVSGVLSRSKG